MSNEIKVGDKVRVSRDVPQFYLEYNSYRMFEIEHRVVDVNMEDGFALLDSIPPKFTTILPTKYLVRVDAEAKEAKFKVGDRVRVKGCGYEPNLHKGDIGEILDTNDKEQCFVLFKKSQAWIYADCLEPYAEPTAPKYKKGDRVKICSKDAARFGCVGTILEVHENGTVDVDFNDYYVGGHLYSIDFIEPYTQPTEQTEAEKPKIGSIKIPVEVDLTDSYWNAYAADLAKEIALKVANKFNDPEQAAEYAVSVAKAVVEGLKRK